MKDAHSNVIRHWAIGGLIGRLGMSLVALSVWASLAWATDVLKISSLLADPTGYNMRLVRVEGMVLDHQMQHFIGSFSKLEKCIQHFTVKDDTASIQAVYATLCPNGSVILQNGDHVTLEAHFSGILDVRSATKN
jgi:cytochrome c-type biogenesis protein CcmE